MLDLSHPKLSELIECGHALRRQGRSADCMEEAAQRVVGLLEQMLRDAEGRPACVLVRLFKTHPLAALPDDLKRLALERIAPDVGSLWAIRCLTLLGTAGELPEWNDRLASAGHQAIPLPSPAGLAQAPMIAQLIRQLGLDAATVLRPDPALILDLEQRNFNIFHILDARGSPYVPAQQGFVDRFDVRSVLGFGGLLPGGDLFAVILFSRVEIPRETADLFRPLALCVKLAMLPFAAGPVFRGEPGRPGAARDSEATVRSRLAALEQLVMVQEDTALEQSRRLEQATADLRRFKFLSDHANDSHFFLDEEGHILYANVTACEWLGYTESELLRLTVPDIAPRVDLERYQSVFRAAQAGRVPPVETIWKRKDGSTFPVEVGATGVRYLGTQYLLGVVRDITDRKRAEEARIASERLYRRLTESTLDAVVVANQDARITLFNPAAQQMFGFTESETIGRDITLLMPEELHQQHHQAIRRYVETREPHVVGRVVELTGRRKSGEFFPLEVALSSIELPDGLVLLASMRDLTERNRMQNRVLQSERLASLGLLSAGVAHEVNNPLAYVASNLAVLETFSRDLLRLADLAATLRAAVAPDRPDLADRFADLSEEIDLPYIRENLAGILASTRQGVQRVASIVQNLRGFARLDQAAVDRVDLRKVVDLSLEMVGQRLAKKQIEVVRMHEEVPPVLCTVAQVNQVVLNLLVNALQAIEAARPDGGRITVRTRAQPPDAVIEVEDNGVGIPPDALARIFEPFYTSKPVGQGTGLGLAISHGIVTDHGGHIEAESTPGQGTTLRVLLPIDGKGGPTR